MAYIIPSYKELGAIPNRPINSRGDKTGLGQSSPSGVCCATAPAGSSGLLGTSGSCCLHFVGQEQCQLLSLISWCTCQQPSPSHSCKALLGYSSVNVTLLIFQDSLHPSPINNVHPWHCLVTGYSLPFWDNVPHSRTGKGP